MARTKPSPQMKRMQNREATKRKKEEARLDLEEEKKRKEQQKEMERAMEDVVTKYTNEELREQLFNLGAKPGPIFDSTRGLYERRCIKLMREKGFDLPEKRVEDNEKKGRRTRGMKKREETIREEEEEEEREEEEENESTILCVGRNVRKGKESKEEKIISKERPIDQSLVVLEVKRIEKKEVKRPVDNRKTIMIEDSEEEKEEEEKEEEMEREEDDEREETIGMEEMDREGKREEEIERSYEERENIDDSSRFTLNYREPEDSLSFAPYPRFVLEVDTPVEKKTNRRCSRREKTVRFEDEEEDNRRNTMDIFHRRESRRNTMDIFRRPSNGRRQTLMEREITQVLEESMEMSMDEKEETLKAKDENEKPCSSSTQLHSRIVDTPKSARESTRSRGTMREVKKMEKKEGKGEKRLFLEESIGMESFSRGIGADRSEGPMNSTRLSEVAPSNATFIVNREDQSREESIISSNVTFVVRPKVNTTKLEEEDEETIRKEKGLNETYVVKKENTKHEKKRETRGTLTRNIARSPSRSPARTAHRPFALPSPHTRFIPSPARVNKASPHSQRLFPPKPKPRRNVPMQLDGANSPTAAGRSAAVAAVAAVAAAASDSHPPIPAPRRIGPVVPMRRMEGVKNGPMRVEWSEERKEISPVSLFHTQPRLRETKESLRTKLTPDDRLKVNELQSIRKSIRERKREGETTHQLDLQGRQIVAGSAHLAPFFY